MNTLARPLSLLLAASLPLACSSSKDKTVAAPAASETYLGLETPTDGFQVRNKGKTVQPGEDVEYCEVAELPGKPSETYYVNRIEFANGKSSHHLIIDAALPGGAAEAKLAAMNVGDQVPCLSAQAAFGDGFEFVGGIQTPYGDMTFPAGVGRKYHGGQRVVFDFHYYNTGDAAVDARSAFNFHTTKAEDVQHIAEIVNFSNFTIDTPAGAKGKFVGECQYSQDVKVASLTRHTHRWGTDYSVWYSGGANDGQQIFTSAHFEEDTFHAFDEPIVVKKGEGFRFECDYDNTENHPLRFGPNATDEMCILFSVAWEANDGETFTKQDCNITQIGSDGIGRVVDPASFPKPTAEQVQACTDGSPLAPTCTECACNACAAVIANCTGDPDCSEILKCVRATGCQGMACAGSCADVINQHSPGTGALIQVGSCMSASCPLVCGGATADAGAP